MINRLLWLCVIAMICACLSCIATETGNPTLDGERLSSTIIGAPAPGSPDMLFITAGPGAVSPAAGRAELYNLDTSDPVESAEVNSDGSFDLDAEVGSGDRLRILIRDGEDASSPLDVFVGAVLTTSPKSNCIRVGEEVRLVEGGRAEIVLRNECEDPIERQRARFRLSTDAMLEDSGPLMMEPNAEVTIFVSELREENTLLVSFEQPMELRAVTLWIP